MSLFYPSYCVFSAGCQDVYETGTEEESTDSANFEPLDDDYKKHKHLHRQIDDVRTHEWPHFQQQVKKSNKDAHKAYARVSTMAAQAFHSTDDLPFKVNKLERNDSTFHAYLSTYFKTIRRGKHGRRELVRKRTFEEKFALLSFYDPLRMKLSFDPPPLEDYDRYCINNELFDHHHRHFQHIHTLSASKPCEQEVDEACGRCGHKTCALHDCFITQYEKVRCKGTCLHCDRKGPCDCCQPSTVVLQIPDGCARSSASLILQKNKRDRFGILREVPPEIPVSHPLPTSDCDEDIISEEGGVPLLVLPLCCHCNYVTCQ